MGGSKELPGKKKKRVPEQVPESESSSSSEEGSGDSTADQPYDPKKDKQQESSSESDSDNIEQGYRLKTLPEKKKKSKQDKAPTLKVKTPLPKKARLQPADTDVAASPAEASTSTPVSKHTSKAEWFSETEKLQLFKTAYKHRHLLKAHTSKHNKGDKEQVMAKMLNAVNSVSSGGRTSKQINKKLGDYPGAAQKKNTLLNAQYCSKGLDIPKSVRLVESEKWALLFAGEKNIAGGGPIRDKGSKKEKESKPLQNKDDDTSEGGEPEDFKDDGLQDALESEEQPMDADVDAEGDADVSSNVSVVMQSTPKPPRTDLSKKLNFTPVSIKMEESKQPDGPIVTDTAAAAAAPLPLPKTLSVSTQKVGASTQKVTTSPPSPTRSSSPPRCNGGENCSVVPADQETLRLSERLGNACERLVQNQETLIKQMDLMHQLVKQLANAVPPALPPSPASEIVPPQPQQPEQADHCAQVKPLDLCLSHEVGTQAAASEVSAPEVVDAAKGTAAGDDEAVAEGSDADDTASTEKGAAKSGRGRGRGRGRPKKR